MSDNVDLPASGVKAATDKVTYSGDTADVQLMRAVHVEGAEGSKTVDEITTPFGMKVLVYGADGSPLVISEGGGLTVTGTLAVQGLYAPDAANSDNPLPVGGNASAAAPTAVDADGDRVRAWFLRNGALVSQLAAAGALIGGDATNGLDVDVTRLPALPAGTNNIGDVDVLTVPADPFGANADAAVAAGAAGSIQAKLRRLTQGVDDLKASIVLAAGTANIGDVDVLTVPADPFGANADAIVAAGATGSMQAKLRRLTQGVEDLKASIVLAAGSAAIGKLAANSGVDIGDVDVTSMPLPTAAATGTVTSQNDQATTVQLLSSDANRHGFRIYNNSTQPLYVKFGTTASLTDFSVKIEPYGYLEENFYYGRVDGIWAADASGAALITALT